MFQSMAVEIKTLQVATKDATERFDETVKQLFEKKKNCEKAVYQVSQDSSLCSLVHTRV